VSSASAAPEYLLRGCTLPPPLSSLQYCGCSFVFEGLGTLGVELSLERLVLGVSFPGFGAHVTRIQVPLQAGCVNISFFIGVSNETSQKNGLGDRSDFFFSALILSGTYSTTVIGFITSHQLEGLF